MNTYLDGLTAALHALAYLAGVATALVLLAVPTLFATVPIRALRPRLRTWRSVRRHRRLT